MEKFIPKGIIWLSMSLVSKGLEILIDEGPISLARKGSKYVRDRTYIKIKEEYILSAEDFEVSFSAPNYTVVQRNNSRFTSEQNVIIDLLQELEEDDVFYDVGANTGLYSLFAAKKCSEVVSFEPYPPNTKVFRKDISRNGLSNVELYEIALSDSNGKITFSQPAEEDIGYGSSSIVNKETENSIEVPTKTGDNLISENNLSPPTVIKIDVEGSEPLVIDGLEESLSKSNCKLIYCEVHLSDVDHRPSIYDFDTNLEDIKSQLRECGFSIEEVEDRGSEVFLKGYK